jgi:hypothetical protein
MIECQDNVTKSILVLARWASKNAPESLEECAETFLKFDDRRKDVVFVDSEQWNNLCDFFDSIVILRDGIKAITWIGKLDELINLYDLIYAGRINEDDDMPPAGSP